MILLQQLDDWLWREPAQPWLRRIVRALRVVRKIAGDVLDGDLPLYAMSLVYTTLLSIVPVLAVSFSVLKGFGVHNQLEPLLLNLLQPLGEKGVEITANVIKFVDNIRVGVLGALGIGLLVYTVISLMQKIERAFNHIWHASGQRSFSRRFSDYLSVILVGPLLVFAALGITGSVMNSDVMQWLAAHEPAQTIVNLVARIVPYGLVIAAFAFIYKLVPYTKVTVKAALLGGLVAGVLWETAGFIFASFIASSAKYTAIYSGFAILLLAMIWIYLSWLILLIGASIGFYYQHPEHVVVGKRPSTLLGKARERAALTVMMLIGRAHQAPEHNGLMTTQALVDAVQVPGSQLDEVLAALHDAKLIVSSDDEPAAWYPAAAIDTIPVTQVLDAVRNGVQTGSPPPAQGAEAVSEVLAQADRAVAEKLAKVSVKDLVKTKKQK